MRKDLGEILKIDFKKNLKKTNVVILLVLAILSCLSLQMGIIRLKVEGKEKLEFLEAEKSQIKQLAHMYQYGYYGITTLAVSTPIYALTYNTTPFGEMESFFDSSIRVKINNPLFGGNIFKKSSGGNLDFYWFLIIFGSGLASWWGFYAFRNKGYLRFLSNITDLKYIYFGIFLSRTLLMSATLLLIGCITFLQFHLNGINLDTIDAVNLLIFFLVAILIMMFFWTIGSISGTFKNIATGMIFSVFVWFTLVFLIPEILNVIFSNNTKSDMKSRYQHQIEKISILSKFNNMVREKMKEVNTRVEMVELNKRLTEQYLNTGFKEIESLESNIIEDISKYTKEFHLLSNITPITFFKSLNNELSGRGFNEYQNFYRLNMENYKRFVFFYFDSILHKRNTQVVPFLKTDDEYIYQTKSSLPKYFGLGIIINCLYIIGVLFIGFFRFKRVLYPLPERADAFDELEFKFKKGKYYRYKYREKEIPDQLYNALKGKAVDFGALTIDGEDIAKGNPPDFFYLPNPETLPGEIKAGSLLVSTARLSKVPKSEIKKLKTEAGNILNKRLDALEPFEKIELLVKLARLKGAKIFFLENFFEDIQEDEVDRVCKELKSDEHIMLELAPSKLEVPKGNFDHYAILSLIKTKYSESIGKRG